VLAASHQRTLARNMPLSIFTAELFATGNDADNRSAVRAAATDKLKLVGIALYGGKN
jgi:hypothetical protein